MSAKDSARQAETAFVISREFDAPRRLIFIVSFSDPTGGISRGPGHLSWPLQMLSAVTFEETGDRTKVTVRWEAYEATDQERKTFQDGMDSMNEGWTGTFEQFDDYLAKVAEA